MVPSPHQRLDLHLPAKGGGPFPVLIWYGGIWEASKNVPDLKRLLPQMIAMFGVETRTLKNGVEEKANPPVSYVMDDACRAVQFVRMNSAKWNLDRRMLSSKVTCVAAYRSQPSIDPNRMQEWVPGMQWGAPALGCNFESH